MKLAIYHAWIHCKGGGEKVLLQLLENSKHDITVYTNKYIPEDTYTEFEKHDIKEIGGLPIVGELIRGLSFATAALLTKIPLKQYDAFIVSTGGVAEIINYRNHSKPLIGFCHTPLRIVHDPEIKKHKLRNTRFLKRQFYKIASKSYQIVEKKAWKYFDHVVFNSETTRERALKADLIEKKQTSINHPGADTEENQPGEYQKYFFYPSRFAYYKRQELAIEAYQKFRENNPDTEFKLVIAGGVNEDKEEYYKQIKEKASKVEGVEVHKNVPGEQWKQLYQNCYTVLFTAINEDWGIIPLEAGSYKKPIISVNQGGPRESIKNEETGYLVPPKPEAFAEKMEKLAQNPEKTRKMGEKAQKHVEKYTWENFIQKFDEKVEEIAG